MYFNLIFYVKLYCFEKVLIWKADILKAFANLINFLNFNSYIIVIKHFYVLDCSLKKILSGQLQTKLEH